MRSSRPPATSTKPNDLMGLYLISLFDPKLGKVQVQADEPLPVVNDDAIPFEIEWARQQDGATVDCGNGRTGRDGIVQSLVPAEYFFVENSFGPKNVGD